MINLNDEVFESTGGVQIFNDGEAGLVKGVEISVEKRNADEPETYPDYKLIATDKTGATVNRGFYYFKPNDSDSEERQKERQNQEISRIVSIARAVMGPDYKLPEVNSIKEAYDTVFKLVKDNAGSKKFNVFVTYGTTSRPSEYLGLRYFNFIESSDTEPTTLRKSKLDQMERLEADKPQEVGATAEDWDSL
jgi:hypothetical protein